MASLCNTDPVAQKTGKQVQPVPTQSRRDDKNNKTNEHQDQRQKHSAQSTLSFSLSAPQPNDGRRMQMPATVLAAALMFLALQEGGKDYPTASASSSSPSPHSSAPPLRLQKKSCAICDAFGEELEKAMEATAKLASLRDRGALGRDGKGGEGGLTDASVFGDFDDNDADYVRE